MHFFTKILAYVKKKQYFCRRKSLTTIFLTFMEEYLYSVEELRASVEEGTRQVERGQYYTDEQVNWMLEQRNRQLA